MPVARLLGVEVREYEKDGKQKVFANLHLSHVEGTVKGVKGCKCENCPCPRDVEVKSLVLGQLYELVYEIYEMKGQTMARLQDLIPVDEPDESKVK